jgi:hypothetical protein
MGTVAERGLRSSTGARCKERDEQAANASTASSKSRRDDLFKPGSSASIDAGF